jgi:hypothetical protein
LKDSRGINYKAHNHDQESMIIILKTWIARTPNEWHYITSNLKGIITPNTCQARQANLRAIPIENNALKIQGYRPLESKLQIVIKVLCLIHQ